MLKKIIQSPYLNFLSGVILLITAGYEVWESFGETAVSATHGILVFSVVHIFRTIPEILHGLEEIETAKENMN